MCEDKLMTTTTIRVNGTAYTVDVSPETPLLWVLRDTLRLTGTKYGCGEGRCGACTVHLDGHAVQSCVTTFGDVGERAVLTIEGLAADELHPLQQAWIEESVAQCGHCRRAVASSSCARTIDRCSESGRPSKTRKPCP